MDPIKIIELHEKRQHGVTNARWWALFRKIVVRTGKFPSRQAMYSFARNMYKPCEQCKKLKDLRSETKWQRIIDPKIK